MIHRRNFPKVFCIGLSLVIAVNILLVFYTKETLQNLILGRLHKEFHLPSPEWDGNMIKRLSHLEADLQHLSKFSMLSLR